MLTRMLGEKKNKNTFSLFLGMQTGAATMEISVEFPQRTTKKSTTWSTYTTFKQKTLYPTTEIPAPPCSALLSLQ